jgi:hypothetical protein
MSVINPIVEGEMDEAAAFKLINASGHLPGVCYGKKGCGYIKSKIQGFNRAARSTCYLTLIDLMDTDLSCAPEVLARWVPHLHPNMLFRVVVPELESWLLADRRNIADFLNVSLVRIPANPEEIQDPKRELVNIARRSSNARVRRSLVPDSGSTAQVGKLYVSEMNIFINMRWDPQIARRISPSLDSCLSKLESMT